MSCLISGLPAELFMNIISFINPEDSRSSILALSRALPLAPIPLHILFEHVKITRRVQVPQLYHRIIRYRRDSPLSARSWIKTVSIENFEVDADVCINLIRTLVELHGLILHIGPKNFSPEHLTELFDVPIIGLKYLALRFRPYLQTVNHYQFLKGSYFDCVLRSLSRWPLGSLPAISIVHDPPADYTPRHFAQPLVFLQLESNISALVTSDAMKDTDAFRLRVPFRSVARFVANPPKLPIGVKPAGPKTSKMTFLDLSTCAVLESEVDYILMTYYQVQHFVLDDCAILKGEVREGDWANLGKRCALVGVRRSKEQGRHFQMVLDTQQTVVALNDPHAAVTCGHGKKTKRGRKGLSTATISLRGRLEEITPDIDPSRVLPLQNNTPRKAAQKLRILPPAPTLKTFCTTISPPSAGEINPPVDNGEQGTPDEVTLAQRMSVKQDLIRQEFAKGWEEGISQLRNHRKMSRESWGNRSARVMRFCIEGEENHTDQGQLRGLADIGEDEEDLFQRLERDDYDEEGGTLPCPIICFAGSEWNGEHTEGCGHAVGRRIYSIDNCN